MMAKRRTGMLTPRAIPSVRPRLLFFGAAVDSLVFDVLVELALDEVALYSSISKRKVLKLKLQAYLDVADDIASQSAGAIAADNGSRAARSPPWSYVDVGGPCQFDP
jgi:hypothetical protein